MATISTPPLIRDFCPDPGSSVPLEREREARARAARALLASVRSETHETRGVRIYMARARSASSSRRSATPGVRGRFT